MEEWIINLATELPLVGFAIFIYLRESKRVDKKDIQLLNLTESVTNGNVKVSEHLAGLARSIDKLDAAIDEMMKRLIEKTQ
jgi:hypothetical protein